MAENSAISWTTHTWNPWMGCTKVSPACDGCYAEALMDKRYGKVQWGNHPRIRTGKHTWNDPLRWQRQAERDGTRPFVFCASLADIFDNQVPQDWRGEAFAVMRKTPRLVYLLLTKRPQNIVKLALAAGGLPANAAIGTTIEDQKRVNSNIPALLAAKAELRPLFAFASCEPLLERISLRRVEILAKVAGSLRAGITLDALSGRYCESQMPYIGDWDVSGPCPTDRTPIALDWVISGGETDQGGHKARPTHPDWFRSLRDQAAAAGVAFHHKQNGEWLGGDQIPEEIIIPSGISNDCGIAGADDNRRVWRVGKKFSGRMLDGVTHDAFPDIPEVTP